MPTLTYVGRAPDSDSILAPKNYADSVAASQAVTTSGVNALVSTQVSTLTTQTYVDAQDALRARRTAVTAADNNYLAASVLNAASGVAGLDSGGNLSTPQVPSGILTDRIHLAFSLGVASNPGLLGGLLSTVSGAVGSLLIGSSSSVTVHTTSLRETKLATMNIPDPGYAWRPLPFGFVQGNSSGSANPGNRSIGTGAYGLLTVMPPAGVSNQIYGIGICTGSFVTETYPLVPYAAAGQTPATVPPITGALELDLYGCCWSGTSYTLLGANLSYWVWVVPAL